jgi:hypothetical protein
MKLDFDLSMQYSLERFRSIWARIPQEMQGWNSHLGRSDMPGR